MKMCSKFINSSSKWKMKVKETVGQKKSLLPYTMKLRRKLCDPGQEMIEKRIRDSETEQCGEDISSDGETKDNFLVQLGREVSILKSSYGKKLHSLKQ
ncbi:hypothetical protein HHI36_000736 [Cryptolaemus montrouzieri]|uniref:Uncharacterized protein n=1 Tax=Cryptolaemus montrouzieri TaxID=559131 RepID=A0ABD2P5L5_9CUCU